MNTVDEIANRLESIEGKTKEVVADLEKLGSIQEALDGSNRTLTAVNAHVSEIAQTGRDAVRGLNEAVGAFREAIEATRRSDPQIIAKSLERMEAENQQILKKLELVDELKNEVGSLRSRIEETAKASDGNTRTTVEGAVKEIGVQNAREMENLRSVVEETAEKSDSKTRSTVERAVERLGAQTLSDRVFGWSPKG